MKRIHLLLLVAVLYFASPALAQPPVATHVVNAQFEKDVRQFVENIYKQLPKSGPTGKNSPTLDQLTDVVKDIEKNSANKAAREKLFGKDKLTREEIKKTGVPKEVEDALALTEDLIPLPAYPAPVDEHEIPMPNYPDVITEEDVPLPTPNKSQRTAYVKAIPVPLPPEPAFHTDYDKRYGGFKKSIKAKAAMAKQELEAKFKKTKFGNPASRDELEKKYKEQANQSEFIKALGPDFQTLSEAEKKKRIAAMTKDMFGGYSAEDIKKMNRKEREKLVNKVGSQRVNDDGSINAPKNYTKVSASTNQDVADALALSEFSAKFDKKMKEIYGAIGKEGNAAWNKFTTTTGIIAEWAGKTIKSLPELHDSEYGTRKNSAPVEVAAEVATYYAARSYAASERLGWAQSEAALLTLFNELDEFVAKYEDRDDLSEQMQMQIAGMVNGGYDAIERLAQESANASATGANAVGRYRCYALYNCADGKKDK